MQRYPHGKERYLAEIDSPILKQQPTERRYFGEGQEVDFAERFRALYQSERIAFYELAYESYISGISISLGQVGCLFNEPPSGPLHVNLQLAGRSPYYQDGSERFPFCHLQMAEIDIHKRWFMSRGGSSPSSLPQNEIVVRCGTGCSRQACADPSCDQYLCPVHGSGKGTFVTRRE